MFVLLKKFYLDKSLISVITKAFIASVLIAFSANLKINIGPIPLTLQTVAISVLAYTLGSRLGVMSVCLYILEGMAGFKVFASGVGISALFGPSGGFIIGFVFMAYIMGLAGDKKILNVFNLSIYSIIASVVLFAFGLFGLSFHVPSDKLLAVGLYPFVLPGFIKAVISAMLLSPAAKYFNRI